MIPALLLKSIAPRALVWGAVLLGVLVLGAWGVYQRWQFIEERARYASAREAAAQQRAAELHRVQQRNERDVRKAQASARYWRQRTRKAEQSIDEVAGDEQCITQRRMELCPGVIDWLRRDVWGSDGATLPPAPSGAHRAREPAGAP